MAGTVRPVRASYPVMLAVSISGMVLLMVLGTLAVGLIAWLLPRAGSSLVVRPSAPDEEPPDPAAG